MAQVSKKYIGNSSKMHECKNSAMEKNRGFVPRFEIIGQFNQTNITSDNLRHDGKKFNVRNKKSRCGKKIAFTRPIV